MLERGKGNMATRTQDTVTNVLFRDSAFAGDVGKANLTAIFRQSGLGSVRRV